MGFDLAAAGGASWVGWHFGPWGRARDWRLHAPDGASYTAGEIAQTRALAHEVCYLSARNRELTDYAHADALHFGPRDALALIAAAELVLRAAQQLALPRLNQRRG